MAARLGGGSRLQQDNKGEIRPGGLVRDPFDEAPDVLPNQRLFGDDGGTGALDEVPVQLVQIGAHDALYTAAVEKRPG
jgi:hypothetical protein